MVVLKSSFNIFHNLGAKILKECFPEEVVLTRGNCNLFIPLSPLVLVLGVNNADMEAGVEMSRNLLFLKLTRPRLPRSISNVLTLSSRIIRNTCCASNDFNKNVVHNWKEEALSIRPKIPEFSKRERVVWKFWKISETVEFPKCEPFNGKFRKRREHNQMVPEFPGRNFPN